MSYYFGKLTTILTFKMDSYQDRTLNIKYGNSMSFYIYLVAALFIVSLNIYNKEIKRKLENEMHLISIIYYQNKAHLCSELILNFRIESK